jgi:hypothetical protein
MNEIDLIIRALERKGSPVEDVFYWNEGCLATNTGFWYRFGVADGLEYQRCWFFGNLSLKLHIAGVIVLTNQMRVAYGFSSTLRGENLGVLVGGIGVNYGVNLLGNGEYEGIKKLYQVGFNWMNVDTVGFGAATFDLVTNFNGFVFKLK